MSLIFLGDIHNQDNAIVNSSNNANLVQGNLGNYALLVEEILVDNGLINDYVNSFNVICHDKGEHAVDRQFLLQLANGTNNNVYQFDAPGAQQDINRHQHQRQNIINHLNHALANLDNVIVVVGDGHLENQHWIPHQNNPQDYPNVNNVIVGQP